MEGDCDFINQIVLATLLYLEKHVKRGYEVFLEEVGSVFDDLVVGSDVQLDSELPILLVLFAVGADLCQGIHYS